MEHKYIQRHTRLCDNALYKSTFTITITITIVSSELIQTGFECVYSVHVNNVLYMFIANSD